MKKKIMSLSCSLCILIILLFGMKIIPLSNAYLNTLETEDDNIIAYIYYSDDNEANSYKSFFGNKGYPTDILNLTEITLNSLSSYDIIIIGYDTYGVFPSSPYYWRDPSKVTIVDNLNTPILGIGRGGTSFFSNLSLDIGWGDTASASRDSIDITNPTHPIFNTPNNITKSSNLIIYNQTVNCYMVYVPDVQPDLTLIGQPPGLSSYYSLIMQQYRYFYWSYHASIDYLNEDGKDILTNVMFYLVGPPPEDNAIPSYNIFIIIGILSLMTFIIAKLYKCSKKINRF